MLCSIYKSPKRELAYLYIEKKDDFSRVPELLLQNFGTPQFVMTLSFATCNKLAHADIHNVKKSLCDNGYYLQLPPSLTENLDY